MRHTCGGTLLWDTLLYTLVGRSCRSPAACRVYTGIFRGTLRAPQWHGASQTHFRPRPRKSAWHCDITNATSPLEANISHDTTNHPAHQRYAALTPAPQWHGATQTHFPPRPRKSAWHCDITNVTSPHGPPHTRSKHITSHHQSDRSPATRRVYGSMFRAPQWHGATQTHFPPRPCKSAGHRRGFESRFESAKRAFRTRRPPKITRTQSP